MTHKKKKAGGLKTKVSVFHFRFLFYLLNTTALLPHLWTAYPRNTKERTGPMGIDDGAQNDLAKKRCD
jgi:hypothetical protein